MQIHLLFQGTATENVVAFQSMSPSGSPTSSPTPLPTSKRTKRPTTAMPTEYLPQDKDREFGADQYKRLEGIILSASPNSKGALSDQKSPQHLAFEWLYNDENGLSNSRLVQRWVLASFYFGLNGDDWLNKQGWVDSKNECTWFGVSCLDGAVSKLELDENRLVGEIVPEFALFGDSLNQLSLGNQYDTPSDKRNQIVMPVPSFLSELTYLSFLNLEGIGLTSTIPEEIYSSLTRLESLYLNENDITGTLSPAIADLKSIEVLWLGGNSLRGSIISEIGQLSTLRDLSLESNFREDTAGKRGFIMTVPSEIGQLSNLEVLDISDNALSGTVPVQLGDLISLRHLDLSNNFFENQLSPALGKLQMLEVLDISYNWYVSQ